MQLISKFNKAFRFLLCVIHIYSKYAWVIPLKDKKRITITNAFQKILDEPKNKPKKVWVNKGSEIYNRWMKTKFTNNLNLKLNTWRNVYIAKLDDIVYKYNNTYHNTIKIKSVVVKSSTYIDCGREIIDKNFKFKIGDIVRISKYKNIFAKGYVPN